MKRLSLRSNTTAIKSIEERILSLLIFSVHGKEYALSVEPIQEIINYAGYTELPLMTNSAHGVVSLRGIGVPVFDLYALLGKSISTIGKRSCIIILNLPLSNGACKKQVLGLLVDSVSDVLEISIGKIEKAPHIGDKMQSDLFSGMIQNKNNFVLILNEKNLFSNTDLIHHMTEETQNLKKAGA